MADADDLAEKEAARAAALRARKKAWRDANPETIARSNAKWRAENPERKKDYQARWNAANPGWNRTYMVRYNEVTREMRQAKRTELNRQAKMRADQLVRARVRARDWAAAHPERAAATRERYRMAHPDRVAQSQQEYYRRNVGKAREQTRAWRAANPEEAAELSRKWRADNREHLAAAQRERRSDPEYLAKERGQNRDRRRIQRRLTKAGLPPPRLHRTPIAGRTENAASATEFFRQATTAVERYRVREDYEPTPPELLQQWRRQSLLAQRRFDAFDRFGPAVGRYLERHGEKVRSEVRMDSRAKELKGEGPLEVEVETRRRVIDIVRRQFPSLNYYGALRATPPEFLQSTAPVILGAPAGSTPPLDPELQRLVELNRRNFPASAMKTGRPVTPPAGRAYHPLEHGRGGENGLGRES